MGRGKGSRSKEEQDGTGEDGDGGFGNRAACVRVGKGLGGSRPEASDCGGHPEGHLCPGVVPLANLQLRWSPGTSQEMG